MAIQKRDKLNNLLRSLPQSYLVDANWMESHGYSRALRKHYVDAGWLAQPTRGVFYRPHGPLLWEHAVASLQLLMEFPVSVGGKTSLELQGYAHYLSPTLTDLYLYTDISLPGWLSKLPIQQEIKQRNRRRLLPEIGQEVFEDDVADHPSGIRKIEVEGIPLVMSTPERAMLELLDEIPKHEDFHHLDTVMGGLVNLRPKLMQSLLENTKSIKVKRLFLFFADRHQHQWLAKIDRQHIDLGAGNRVLAKNGVLDKKYQITVPEGLDADY